MNALQLKHYFDPEIERNNIAHPMQQPTVQDEDEQNTDDTQTRNQQDNENTQPATEADVDQPQAQPQSQADIQDEDIERYPYDIRKLIKYRHKDQYFRIEWTDGSKTWEPQENVRPDLVEEYFQKYIKRTPPKTLTTALYSYILLHISFTVLYNRSEKAVLHQSVV